MRCECRCGCGCGCASHSGQVRVCNSNNNSNYKPNRWFAATSPPSQAGRETHAKYISLRFEALTRPSPLTFHLRLSPGIPRLTPTKETKLAHLESRPASLTATCSTRQCRVYRARAYAHTPTWSYASRVPPPPAPLRLLVPPSKVASPRRSRLHPRLRSISAVGEARWGAKVKNKAQHTLSWPAPSILVPPARHFITHIFTFIRSWALASYSDQHASGSQPARGTPQDEPLGRAHPRNLRAVPTTTLTQPPAVK